MSSSIIRVLVAMTLTLSHVSCSDSQSSDVQGDVVDRDTTFDALESDARGSMDTNDTDQDVSSDVGTDVGNDDSSTDIGDVGLDSAFNADGTDDLADQSRDVDHDIRDVSADSSDLAEDGVDRDDELDSDPDLDTAVDFDVDDILRLDVPDTDDEADARADDADAAVDIGSSCSIVNANSGFEETEGENITAWTQYGDDGSGGYPSSREDWADSDESSPGSGRAAIDDGEFGLALHGWVSTVDAEAGVYQHVVGGAVQADATYSLSLDMHVETDFNVEIYEIKLEFWDSIEDGTLLHQVANNLLDGDYTTGTDASDASEWQQVFVEGVAPDGAARVTIVVNFGGTFNQDTLLQAARIDNVELLRCQ